MIFGMSAQSFAIDSNAVNTMVKDTAEYVYKTLESPQVGSVGGEWAILGLARSGEEIPDEYYEKYYSALEEYVKTCDGVLHSRKYTEYSRVIVALSAIGKNPADVAGYNLLAPLGDYEKTIWQGINGSVWALIALDCAGYEMPQNPDAEVQATREMYINHILKAQNDDGGWALSGDVSDPDITAMALSALAKYQGDERVKSATEKALLCLSEMQNDNGGFSSWGTENSESCIQVIVALCELGLSLDDTRFVKNGKTMLDYLLIYYTDENGFKHTLKENAPNQMATEQGLYCLAAMKRLQEGKSSLYCMDDAAANVETIILPELRVPVISRSVSEWIFVSAKISRMLYNMLG